MRLLIEIRKTLIKEEIMYKLTLYVMLTLLSLILFYTNVIERLRVLDQICTGIRNTYHKPLFVAFKSGLYMCHSLPYTQKVTQLRIVAGYSMHGRIIAR